MTTVLKLSQQVTELKEVSAAEVVTEQIPKRWAPNDAVHDIKEIEGKVTSATYSKGAMLQASMFQDPPQLTEGYREVSIMIDAETGVAGKISPGSRVDIVSTLEDTNAKQHKAQVIIQNALITEVGVATKVQDKNEEGSFSEEKESVPVTFSLTPEDSLKLAYAESFSTNSIFSISFFTSFSFFVESSFSTLALFTPAASSIISLSSFGLELIILSTLPCPIME